MKSDFIEVKGEGFSAIAYATKKSPSALCDFTPFVLLMWQRYYKTSFCTLPSGVALRYEIDGHYMYALLSENPIECINELFSLVGGDELSLTLVDERVRECILNSPYKIVEEIASDEWMDYVYLHEELVGLSGKKFSGQRNHINKFISTYPDWCYEAVTGDNIGEVLQFFKDLTKDTGALNETALYEREMLISFMTDGFGKGSLSDMTGGLIRAGGEVVSFAFGEVLLDTLFVHAEKARRDVQGAYQMIVREYARHNPAVLINREEDMGIEGLRISKNSYHPIKKEKKFNIIIEK